MPRRNVIQIRKQILTLLQQKGELSLRQLESKADTNYQTIKRQIIDLESLGFISVKQHKSHPRNKRAYQTCKITEDGINWLSKCR